MKRYVDRLRRTFVRNRHGVEQVTACVLGLSIGIALGALSLGGHPQPQAGARGQHAAPVLAGDAARG
jgi:hypothetical protein